MAKAKVLTVPGQSADDQREEGDGDGVRREDEQDASLQLDEEVQTREDGPDARAGALVESVDRSRRGSMIRHRWRSLGNPWWATVKMLARLGTGPPAE
ncbi:MAG: hypothetical protein U0361_20265 [Nitrospiraceae bacterium]